MEWRKNADRRSTKNKPEIEGTQWAKITQSKGKNPGRGERGWVWRNQQKKDFVTWDG